METASRDELPSAATTRGGAVDLPVTSGHADDPSGALVEDGVVDVGALNQVGPQLDRMPGDQVVEVGAVAGESVGRVVGQRWPVEGERLHASAVDPQALVVEPAGFLGDVDAQAGQDAGGTWREAVATDLLAREVRLLEQRHLQAATGQVSGGGCTTGSGSDDDDVGLCVAVTGTGALRDLGVRHQCSPGFWFCPHVDGDYVCPV